MEARRSRWIVPGTLLAFAWATSCGSEFSTQERNDAGSDSGAAAGVGGQSGSGGTSGTSTGGSSGGDGGTGGTAGTGGSAGSGATGGSSTGGAGGSSAGGAGGVGGSGGSSGAATDAGLCRELTALVFQNGGFESGAPAPGWAGSGNYPQYASVTIGAARTGSYGAELNDTGAGVPGIEQKVPVSGQLVGRTVSVTAWVRLVSFPGMRLLLEANAASGLHVALELSDTDPSNPDWQKLAAAVTIPATTDHLMIKVLSSVTDANGIAYADDVQVCMDDLCSPCASGQP